MGTKMKLGKVSARAAKVSGSIRLRHHFFGSCSGGFPALFVRLVGWL